MTKNEQYDVLIIGSGAAGLSLALRLPKGTRTAVVSKRELREGSTYYAQGGISAVLDEADSLESHIKDTLDAGAGLCDEEVVELVVERGPENIRWLLSQGVEFTSQPATGSSGYHLTREGGHSHRRVVHAADATGKVVELSLENQARNNPDIRVLEHHIAVDLICTPRDDGTTPRRCLGAYLLDLKQHRVRAIAARFVVLATGGANKVYLYTSNPDVATGDGIAMGWRAGCRVANMEFIQFHPTCLYHPNAKSFLISEAVRGEGGRLLLPNGERFMPRYDERAELAPRDIVARAIDAEMKRLGIDCVYLDISHRDPEFIKSHFPNIYKRCLELGIDITREPIPVVPAAHYTCGGIVTDRNARTDIAHLYAVGETAYTGLHGANRMASNSLLECLVFGLRRFMWDYMGIVRSNKRLARAQRRINLLRHEIREYYSNFRVSNDLLELRNIADVSELIIQSAIRRRESRGLHYNKDFPWQDEDQRKPTILIPESYVPKRRV